MEQFLLELEDYQEMLQSDIKFLEGDWRSLYSKDFLLNLLINHLQDFSETIARYKTEVEEDNQD